MTEEQMALMPKIKKIDFYCFEMPVYQPWARVEWEDTKLVDKEDVKAAYELKHWQETHYIEDPRVCQKRPIGLSPEDEVGVGKNVVAPTTSDIPKSE